ncbi:MAG: TetR/AcrR family transcriptional regulator, partial [Thermodesulfobacteriota bacterium]
MKKSREKIIEVAGELFHKRGYHQTSLDEILEESGVTKSNFYYHFKTKEELALTVLDMRIKQFESEVVSGALGESYISPKNRLLKLYDRVIKFHRVLKCKGGCPFGNLAIEMSDVNDKFRERLSQFFTRWEKAIESCVIDGIEKGEFRSDINPGSTAGIILSQLEGAIMMVKTHKTIDSLVKGTQTVLKLLEA